MTDSQKHQKFTRGQLLKNTVLAAAGIGGISQFGPLRRVAPTPENGGQPVLVVSPPNAYLPSVGHAAQTVATQGPIGEGITIDLAAPGPRLVNRIWGFTYGIYGSGTSPDMNTGLSPILTLTDSNLGTLVQGPLSGFVGQNSSPNWYPNTNNGQLVGSLNGEITLTVTSPGANNQMFFTLFYEVSEPRPADLMAASQIVSGSDNSLTIPSPGTGRSLYIAQCEWATFGKGTSVTNATPEILKVTDNGLARVVGYAAVLHQGANGSYLPSNQNTGFTHKVTPNSSVTFLLPDPGQGMSTAIAVFYRVRRD